MLHSISAVLSAELSQHHSRHPIAQLIKSGNIKGKRSSKVSLFPGLIARHLVRPIDPSLNRWRLGVQHILEIRRNLDVEKQP